MWVERLSLLPAISANSPPHFRYWTLIWWFATWNLQLNCLIDLHIDKGRGYVPSEENNQQCTNWNYSCWFDFHPIRNVKYSVENYRVEQKTDYEKLVMEITSDGSIPPERSFERSCGNLIHHFMLFSDEKITLETKEKLLLKNWMRTHFTCVSCWVQNWLIWIFLFAHWNCLKAADVET